MSLDTNDLAALLGAVVLAAAGGEAFLRGVLGVSAQLRLPKFLVATTLAAIATSSPELTVSTVAALAGKPEVGLGDALGSNVVNIALILGLALLFGALPARFGDFRRDFLLAVAAPLLTLFLLLDGELTRGEGALLLSLFALWLVFVARQALAHRRETAAQAEAPAWSGRIGFFLLAGLAALILAGHLFVFGATGVARNLGIDLYVVGAVLVAIGTSLPELVTVLIARWRGHDEVGLGTLLGSNLFNGLAIVGATAAIHPIRVPFAEAAPALAFGVLVVLMIVPRHDRLTRTRGVLLLLAYATFVGSTLVAGGAIE